MADSQNTPPLSTKFTQVLVSLVIIGFLLIAGKVAFCPLIFSSLFSILLLPVARYLEKKFHFNRALAAMVSVFVFLAVLFLIVFIAGTQIHVLINDWALFKEQILKISHQVYAWATSKLNIGASDQSANIQNMPLKLIGSNPKVIEVTLISASSILLFLVFIVFETFFILFYRSLLYRFLISLVNPAKIPVVETIVKKIQSTVRSYIIGLLTEMTIVTVTCCLSFWAIGVKYPFLLGLIVGLFNVVPYVGIFTALLVCVTVSAAMATATKVALVVGTIVAMHLIDSNILLPFIVGAKVKINALVTILGLTIGEFVWQIPGMVLSIPIMAILKIIFDHVDGLKPFGLLLGDPKKQPANGH